MDEENRNNTSNNDSNIHEDGVKNESENVADLSGDDRKTKMEKITNLYLDRLQQEIQNGYRVFTYKDKEYKIFLTKVKEDDLINRFKSKTVSKLLEDESIYMKDQLMRRLYDRGVWDDKKEKEEKALRERLGKVMADIMIENSKQEMDKDSLQELFKERLVLEVKLNELVENKNNVISSCMENILDEAVHKFKMTLCVKDNENNTIWNSIEEIDNYQDKLLVTNISEAAMYFWSGWDPALFSLAPNE